MASTIDRQRLSAVATLERLGWTFDGKAWSGPAAATSGLVRAADDMHDLLAHRAVLLAGCVHDNAEADELEAIANALDAYERQRHKGGRD